MRVKEIFLNGQTLFSREATGRLFGSLSCTSSEALSEQALEAIGCVFVVAGDSGCCFEVALVAEGASTIDE